MTPRRLERGLSVSVEAALILPVLVLFMGLVALVGRDLLHQQAVASAASHAARAASLERTPAKAREAASRTAATALSDSGLACRDLRITTDAAGLRAPLGQPSTVQVRIRCTLQHRLTIPGYPTQRTHNEVGSSPVDTYRGR